MSGTKSGRAAAKGRRTSVGNGRRHGGKELLSLYRRMLLIRLFEQEAERQYKRARIGGYCHLAIGQEAATLGVVAPMQESDVLLTSYRSHGFALARGTPPERVMAELFGRATGCAHGRGGSMHLADVERGYLGGWGIVGGQLPIAVGIGLALAREAEGRVCVCELGDGAVNTGAWHESLNLAALWRLPVLFVVMNNGYGMGTTVERASAETELHRRAAAYRVRAARVDGCDVDAVTRTAAVLLKGTRSGRPAVLEVLTYRLRGHSVADPGTTYRSRKELERWEASDPVAAIRGRLLDEKHASESGLEEIEAGVISTVSGAVEYAEASSEPRLESLAEHTYAGWPDFARMTVGAPFGEGELISRAARQ